MPKFIRIGRNLEPTEVDKRRLPKIIRTGRSVPPGTYDEEDGSYFDYIHTNPSMVYYIYTKGMKIHILNFDHSFKNFDL